MKIKSLLATGIVLFTQGAFAANDWKGCYAGVNLAYGNGDNNATTTFYQGEAINNYAGSADSNGSLTGLQLGCDTTLNDKWVIGAKISAQTSGVDGKHLYQGGTGPSNYLTYKTNDMFGLQGRIGYLLNESSLVYFQTGFVRSEQEYTDTDPDFNPPIELYAKQNHSGWTAGIGFEHQFTEKFSFFTEYNHADFGTKDNIVQEDRGGLGIDDTTLSVEQSLNTFNIGVNYRF